MLKSNIENVQIRGNSSVGSVRGLYIAYVKFSASSGVDRKWPQTLPGMGRILGSALSVREDESENP